MKILQSGALVLGLLGLISCSHTQEKENLLFKNRSVISGHVRITTKKSTVLDGESFDLLGSFVTITDSSVTLNSDDIPGFYFLPDGTIYPYKCELQRRGNKEDEFPFFLKCKLRAPEYF